MIMVMPAWSGEAADEDIYTMLGSMVRDWNCEKEI